MNNNKLINNEIFAHLITDWLGAKYFKTFKIQSHESDTDFIIAQREKKFLLSVCPLWDERDDSIIEIEKNVKTIPYPNGKFKGKFFRLLDRAISRSHNHCYMKFRWKWKKVKLGGDR